MRKICKGITKHMQATNSGCQAIVTTSTGNSAGLGKGSKPLWVKPAWGFCQSGQTYIWATVTQAVTWNLHSYIVEGFVRLNQCSCTNCTSVHPVQGRKHASSLPFCTCLACMLLSTDICVTIVKPTVLCADKILCCRICETYGFGAILIYMQIPLLYHVNEHTECNQTLSQLVATESR